MSAQNRPSPREFLDRLREDTLTRPVVLIGMVRSVEGDNDRIEFSGDCLSWIPIPVGMIEEVENLGVKSCKDHAHHVAKILLVAPRSEEETVLSRLIVEYRSPLPGGDVARLDGCADCMNQNCPDKSDFFTWLQCVAKYCDATCAG
ncbi:hypothetical protein ACF1AB_39135 [Streptomyces sp. NPDC014846]|uniref:hypothetical protein n=1 Tax=Streptomyces sp. NPDC014846 TaxID=3364922 RepID=UPI0036F6FF78